MPKALHQTGERSGRHLRAESSRLSELFLADTNQSSTSTAHSQRRTQLNCEVEADTRSHSVQSSGSVRTARHCAPGTAPPSDGYMDRDTASASRQVHREIPR